MWFSAHNARGETVATDHTRRQLHQYLLQIGRPGLIIKARVDDGEGDVWEKIERHLEQQENEGGVG